MQGLNLISKIERISKKIWIRLVLVAIPVVVSAIYTNARNHALISENKSCVSDIKDLKDENTGLKYDVLMMKNNLIQLSVAQDVYPNPKWFKSRDGIMLQLNKAYEDLYLLPNGLTRGDYIGKSDYDVWPKNVADQFRIYDSLVLTTGKTITRIEPVMINGRMDSVKVTKYLVEVNGMKIGTGGFVDITH